MAKHPHSLDHPVGDSGENVLGELLTDARKDDPLLDVNQQELKKRLAQLVRVSSPRENEILSMR